MMARGSSESVRAHAAEEDENQWALLAIAIVVATAALAAIVFELGPVKDMTGLRKGEHIGLVAATILSAWTFTHVMFALHYAGEYYAAGEDGVRAGLRFPDEEAPGWGEFVYQAFVIGCACSRRRRKRHVEIDAPRLPRARRRRVLLQYDHPGADDQHRRGADLTRRRALWDRA